MAGCARSSTLTVACWIAGCECEVGADEAAVERPVVLGVGGGVHADVAAAAARCSSRTRSAGSALSTSPVVERKTTASYWARLAVVKAAASSVASTVKPCCCAESCGWRRCRRDGVVPEAGGLGEDQDARPGPAALRRRGGGRRPAAAESRRLATGWRAVLVRRAHARPVGGAVAGEGEVVHVEELAVAALEDQVERGGPRGGPQVVVTSWKVSQPPVTGTVDRAEQRAGRGAGADLEVPPAPPEETRAVNSVASAEDVRLEGDPVAVVDVADGLAAVGAWPWSTTATPGLGRRSARPGGAWAGATLWSWLVSGGWPPPPLSVYSASKTPKMLAFGSCSPSALVLMVPEQPVRRGDRVAVAVVAEDVGDLDLGAVDRAVLGVGDRHLERHVVAEAEQLAVAGEFERHLGRGVADRRRGRWRCRCGRWGPWR